MENYGSFGLNTTSKPSRKRRTNLHRRPTNEYESPQEYRDSISLSSTPSDPVSDASYTDLVDTETVKRGYDEGEVFDDSIALKRSVEDIAAEACWKNLKMENNKASDIVVGGPGPLKAASDEIGNKFNKVKLKVGGVTRTIHTRSSQSAPLDDINNQVFTPS